MQPYTARLDRVEPRRESPIDFYADWMTVPTNQIFDNGFKTQWEMFLRHVLLDVPFPYGLREGAKGVQLAEKYRVVGEALLGRCAEPARSRQNRIPLAKAQRRKGTRR